MTRIYGWFIIVILAGPLALADDFYPARIVAHRGLLKHAPENTLANFRACLELRLGFEFDVQRTRDGQLICLHDETLERTTNGQGKVADLTLNEIRRFDAGRWFDPRFVGEKVPTIDEVLHLLGEYRQHDVLVCVDFKAIDVEQEVARLAVKHNVLSRLLFIGRTITEPQVRDNILKIAPQAQVAMLANNAAEYPAALADPKAPWVYVRFIPNREQVAAARRAQKRIFIAGVTVAGLVPDNWKQARDVGLDGILSDFPLELRATLKAHDDAKWQALFDGKSLAGWDPGEFPQSFNVIDGAIAAGRGPLARLSYVGPIHQHEFKDFELKVEIKTKPGSNGGVFFHTGPQKIALKKGYEVQVCNSCPDQRKSGSLLVVEDHATSPVLDDEWFEYHITVIGKRILVRVNGKTTVDYTEPDQPQRPESWEQRRLSQGLIALQAHDADSLVYYRNIRVKVIPSDSSNVRAAAERGLHLLQRSARAYPQHRKCFACHHQTFPLLASNTAATAGLVVDRDLATEIGAFTRTYLQGRIDQIRDGKGVPGRGFMASYAAWTLQLVTDAKSDEATNDRELEDALTQYLLKTQEADGHWKPPSIRPPLEESFVTGTVLARRHLHRTRARLTTPSSSDAEAASNSKHLASITAALERSQQWLDRAPLPHHEDRVLRLWSLTDGTEPSTSAELIQTLQKQLIATQHQDGGWSQTDSMDSDAYATGQAIYVLLVSGVKANDPVIQRGVEYLLTTQATDGSWHVKTRSKPIQEFFDNGDPYEKDQFISITATGWAVTALAKSL